MGSPPVTHSLGSFSSEGSPEPEAPSTSSLCSGDAWTSEVSSSAAWLVSEVNSPSGAVESWSRLAVDVVSGAVSLMRPT